ncbi:polysaccharide biosynthesis/export family protein [Sphingomonas hengshuiensis]|uniref:Polysaccharide export protein n=1 Tax=Sphingomonas hengshuiensis TaxID=1609977 RepID=A0A7U4JBR0_9SPHN|nr:polysaccharide biosynthesis/export family protein [Sphingomonas hengshuiensis]AJP73891.1 hypothetical protein TS85_21955 [Sphingomonas hengshuiensis]
MALVLSGCSKPLALAGGEEAYGYFPPSSTAPDLQKYRFQTFDRVSVSVLREPDLSRADVEIGSDGTVAMPLLGSVVFAGKTADELRREIGDQLSLRALLRPDVVVSLTASPSRTVTVEGSVNQPGVYPIAGSSDLLSMVSMARGTDRTAHLREVAVFRRIDGVQMGAKFDLQSIRRGDAANPEILPGDIVVVGLSNVKSIWRDVLQASPIFALFTRL